MFQGSGGIFQDPDDQTWPVLEVSNILFTPLNLDSYHVLRICCIADITLQWNIVAYRSISHAHLHPIFSTFIRPIIHNHIFYNILHDFLFYPALSCVRLWPLHAGDEGFAIATRSLASIERGQYQHHGEPWCESAELGRIQAGHWVNDALRALDFVYNLMANHPIDLLTVESVIFIPRCILNSPRIVVHPDGNLGNHQ